MPRRWMPVVAGLLASALVSGCGGGGAPATQNAQPTSSTAVTTPLTTSAPASTTTTRSPIEGVETFPVAAGHTDAPVSYPQTPPVGGMHNPVWQQCAFYDRPVENERAVHSLEHGAIWITYRPDLPTAEIESLATLARSRKDVLASLWDDALPAPLVATAWGRQLRLQSATDARLLAFVALYAHQGPEPNAPC